MSEPESTHILYVRNRTTRSLRLLYEMDGYEKELSPDEEARLLVYGPPGSFEVEYYDDKIVVFSWVGGTNRIE